MTTTKLEDFRLLSYDERSILGTALLLYRDRYPESYPAIVEALSLRLSRTECQAGGCSMCRPENHPDYPEY